MTRGLGRSTSRLRLAFSDGAVSMSREPRSVRTAVLGGWCATETCMAVSLSSGAGRGQSVVRGSGRTISVGVSTLGEDAVGGRTRPEYLDHMSIDKGDVVPDFELPDQTARRGG